MATERKISILDNGNLELFIPARLKKSAGRKIIIAPEEDAGKMEYPDEEHSIPAVTLSRHLARAHSWLNALENGTFQNVLQLAEELNIDPSFIGRILRLVNLAPDIQEAIINGTEPDNLTFNDLRGSIPDEWQEQREILKTKACN